MTPLHAVRLKCDSAPTRVAVVTLVTLLLTACGAAGAPANRPRPVPTESYDYAGDPVTRGPVLPGVTQGSAPATQHTYIVSGEE